MRSFDDGTSFFCVHPGQAYLAGMSFFLKVPSLTKMHDFKPLSIL